MCHFGDHKNCKLLQSAFVFLVLFGQSALGYDFWGVDVAVQYELRQQGMFLASQRQTQLLPEANGGPSYTSSPLYDPRPSNSITCSDGTAVQYTNVRDGSTIDATLGALTDEALQYGTICQGVFGQAVPTYAGDINSDDWRLNFDRGDVLQAPSTLNTTVDLHKQSRFGDIWATINLEALFDSALSDNSTFDRSGLDATGRDKVARYWQLDGYAQLKTRIFGNRALNILLGQQEIQWGEPTFLPGGISWFNPLDVPRFRQTGYTHGWIPVNALQTQFTWSRSLSFAGYWGGWDHYRFDVPGTYAGVGGDVWVSGAGSGGNQNRFIIGSGSYFTGNSWPCQYQDATAWQDGVINTNTQDYAEVLSAYAPNCPGVPDVLTPVEIGYAERDRIAASDPWALIKRGEDQSGSQSYGLLTEFQNRKTNLSVQLSYQGGDARVPMVNYQTGQPGVLPYAIGVMDNIIARGATQSGLGALTNGAGVPYKSDYNNISVNAEGQALLSELRNSGLGLDTYGATEGSVAEMNAYQYQLATTQSESVTASTPLGFETAGAMFTGAINIRPDLNLGLYADYPYENIYGLSMKYIGFGQSQVPLFMNIAYRPNTPLQFDSSEMMIASLFNNCFFSQIGAYESALLNQEPYHNEFNLAKGQNRVGCRDVSTRLPGFTEDYDGWVVDLVGQGLVSDQRILRSDRLFGRVQMRSIYAGGISERANTSLTQEVNGEVVRGPLMPLDNVCVSGSDLPLASIIGLDPRDALVCRPTEYSMGIVLAGGIDYQSVMLMGKSFTLTPGVFLSRGMIGRTPRPLGIWLKDVGSYILGLQAKDNRRWTYELQYRGYFGPSLYNNEVGQDAVFLSMQYRFNH